MMFFALVPVLITLVHGEALMINVTLLQEEITNFIWHNNRLKPLIQFFALGQDPVVSKPQDF
jgi:hypothetical protein